MCPKASLTVSNKQSTYLTINWVILIRTATNYNFLLLIAAARSVILYCTILFIVDMLHSWSGRRIEVRKMSLVSCKFSLEISGRIQAKQSCSNGRIFYLFKRTFPVIISVSKIYSPNISSSHTMETSNLSLWMFILNYFQKNNCCVIVNIWTLNIFKNGSVVSMCSPLYFLS